MAADLFVDSTEIVVGPVESSVVTSPVSRIINGTVTNEFPSVGIVGDSSGGYCSGTLIAPQYVLSAAHCAEGVANTAGRVTFGAATYSTSQVIIYPGYNDALFGTDAANDLAIYKLNTPVVGIAPSNIYRSTPTVGSLLTLVGYGGGGTGNTGSDGSFGTKRVGTTPIDLVTSTLIHWDFENNTESNTAPGDSGGPAFVEVSGEYLVAGITSGGNLTSAAIGDHSFDTRVDVYQTWIDGILNPVTTSNFVDYTAAGSTYTQAFNSLVASGTSSTLPSGWAFSESGTNSNTIYTANNGTGNSGDTYSFGATGNSDRAFGGLQSGSLNPTIGVSIKNNTGTTLTSMTIGYIGEQWRLGTAGRPDRLDFQYSLNATALSDTNFTDVNALDFLSPISAGTLGALDGNAAANRTNRSATISSLSIPHGATLWLRWNDFSASGADDGLALDDFVFTATGESVSNTAPTISSLSNQETAFQTATPAIPFTVDDAETAASSLIVTATSSNPTLLPVAGILLGGSGADRTVTLTPAAGQSGVTNITLSVFDGLATTSTSFELTVLAGAVTTSHLRIVSYNISGASGNGTPRTGFETLMQAMGTEVVSGLSKQVDLFAIQEVLSQATTSTIIANSLNNLYGTLAYASGTLNGGTTGSGTQGVVYNTQTLQLLDEAVVGTASSTAAPRQTLRHHFRPVGTTGSSDFYVYNSHLKASDSGADADRRFQDVQVIRADADALPQGSNIIYVGDFNLFRSTESAYQEFLSAGNGQAFDPINRPGNWSGNAGFKDIFTQAPSATSQPELGLDGGGMDDRLDFQLNSGELSDGTALEYRTGSYHTFGVNGSVTVNGSIDDPSNTALLGLANRLTLLGLLRTVSDHLPVVADYTFSTTITNEMPTDIALVGNSLAENQPSGTIVGMLNTIDSDFGDSFAYSLVPGTGSTDNHRFSIVGNTLRSSAAIDFESMPTLSIRVRSTDQGGLFFEKPFAVNVSNINDASVVNRQIFYNRSSSAVFGDGTGNPIAAIDDSKLALLPGQTATAANYTNVVNGINGLVVDVDGIVSAGVADFQFAEWNGIDAGGFAETTAIPTITMIPSGGLNGSSRVKIEFDNGLIRNTWLRISVLASANTDLAVNDVFYFGNATGDFGVGNIGSPITVRTNATDTSTVRQNQSISANSVGIAHIYDLNKDGRVNATDTSLVRQNQASNLLSLFTAPASLQLARVPGRNSTSAPPLTIVPGVRFAFLQPVTSLELAEKENARALNVDRALVAITVDRKSDWDDVVRLKDQSSSAIADVSKIKELDAYFADWLGNDD